MPYGSKAALLPSGRDEGWRIPKGEHKLCREHIPAKHLSQLCLGKHRQNCRRSTTLTSWTMTKLSTKLALQERFIEYTLLTKILLRALVSSWLKKSVLTCVHLWLNPLRPLRNLRPKSFCYLSQLSPLASRA